MDYDNIISYNDFNNKNSPKDNDSSNNDCKNRKRKFSLKKVLILLLFLISLFAIGRVFAADQNIRYRVILANWYGANTVGQDAVKYIYFDLSECTEVGEVGYFCQQDVYPYKVWNSPAPPNGTTMDYVELHSGKHKNWTVPQQYRTVESNIEPGKQGYVGLYLVDATATTPYIKLPYANRKGYRLKGWNVVERATPWVWYNEAYRTFSGNDKTCDWNSGGYFHVNIGAYSTVVKVKPVFEANNYTLTVIDNNGGSFVGGTNLPVGGTSASFTLTSGSTNYYWLGTAQKENCEFLGFYTSPTGGTRVYKPDGSCDNDSGVWSDNKFVYGNNITVYARYKINSYTNGISHWATGFTNQEGNNGDKSCYLIGSTSYKKNYNNNVNVSSSDAVRVPNGLYLVGHFGSNTIDGTGNWKSYNMPYSFKQPDRSTWLEMYYSPKTYKISYDLDGGAITKNNASSYNVYYGVKFSNKPTKTGYTFLGWKDTSSIINKDNLSDNYNTTISGSTYTFTNTTSGNRLNHAAIQIWDNSYSNYYQDICGANYTGHIESTYTHTRGTGAYGIRIKANGNTQDSSVFYKNCYFEQGKTYKISLDINSIASSKVVISNPKVVCDSYVAGINPGKTAKFSSVNALYNALDNRLTGNRNIKACWEVNYYNIKYDLNDSSNDCKGALGKNAPNKMTYNQKSTVDNPTRDGYIFTGWTITGMDSITHYYGKNTTTNTKIKSTKETEFMNLTSKKDATIIFKANWKLNVSISLDVNDENYHVNETVKVKDIRESLKAVIKNKTNGKVLTDKFFNGKAIENIRIISVKDLDKDSLLTDSWNNFETVIQTNEVKHLKVTYMLTIVDSSNDNSDVATAECKQNINIINDEEGSSDQLPPNLPTPDPGEDDNNHGTSSSVESNIRYISKKHINTLSINSKWQTNSELNSELISSLNKEANDDNAIYIIEISKEKSDEIKSYITDKKAWNKDLNKNIIDTFGNEIIKKKK